MTHALDQATAVRGENTFAVETILPFLREHIPDLPTGEVTLQQFSGGASNLTYQLTVGTRALILRRPPSGTKAKTAHDMGREVRVLTALNPHFPCPKPLAYCQDESLIGSPFYVMEKISGVILRRDIPKDASYDPAHARQLCLNLIDTQIKLHQLDYRDIGLENLGKPEGYVARQITGWCERFIAAHTDDVPRCEPVMAWLKAQQPKDSPKASLIHNDYRFDNVVLSPKDAATIIGVLDWEMATIGDPLMDLGSSLAYWVQSDDPKIVQGIRMQPSNLPGMLSRSEILDYYQEKTGIEVACPQYYYVFGLFRLAVIAQQIYKRFKLGQTSNPRYQAFGVFVTILNQAAEAAIAKY